jgi:tetratricopeptide (TPR) repeat protein
MAWRRRAEKPERAAMQRLLNFDMIIEPIGGSYRTRVVASPGGEADAEFTLPFGDRDLEILVLKIIGSVGRARRQARRIGSQERHLLETFGGQLFKAVFAGDVRECLGRSRLAADRKDAGLRIRMRLPPALANIPWEYLYDREHGFLTLSPDTALVRYVELPAPVRPLPINPPLRMLAMISAPSDLPGLSGEEEWSKVNGALSDLIRCGTVEVDRLEGGTLAAMQRPLRLRDYHVLHFVGHAYYDEDAQDGALALEGPGRKTRLVTGRDLGLMLRGHRSLRLVVLNACEGARSAKDDPFGGVAQALVRLGIPSVIAMQFEISDPAAVVFSRSFYQAIADGLPVDLAVVEARLAMFAEGHEVEWATPVLYLRSPDGRVFIRGRASDNSRKTREEADEQFPEDQQAPEDTDQQVQEDAERGETYRLAKRYEEALADLDRAIELNPDYAGAIAQRGLSYRDMGRYEEALADLDRAIELNPDYAWAIAQRGQTYRLAKRYEEALADFNRAIELNPNLDWAIAQRGVTYRLAKRYEEALADFNRAIELNPNLDWAIAQRGVTYRLMKWPRT